MKKSLAALAVLAMSLAVPASVLADSTGYKGNPADLCHVIPGPQLAKDTYVDPATGWTLIDVKGVTYVIWGNSCIPV